MAAPAPAASGGAAAAVAAAMAASLVVMVGSRSPEWADGAVAATTAEGLRRRLLELADEDVTAFRAVLEAERTAGQPALRAALIAAAVPPLEIARAATAVAELAATAAEQGKSVMRADAAVAARLSRAAAEAGLLTVETNLSGAESTDLIARIAAEADTIAVRLREASVPARALPAESDPGRVARAPE